jgi:hypothetical protein
MTNYNQLITDEKARFVNAPMRELRNISVALAIHSWGNTIEEKARAVAVESLISERLHARRKGGKVAK